MPISVSVSVPDYRNPEGQKRREVEELRRYPPTRYSMLHTGYSTTLLPEIDADRHIENRASRIEHRAGGGQAE